MKTGDISMRQEKIKFVPSRWFITLVAPHYSQDARYQTSVCIPVSSKTGQLSRFGAQNAWNGRYATNNRATRAIPD
jgi:hypothetical protein